MFPAPTSRDRVRAAVNFEPPTALHGGISAQTMAASREELDAELLRKVPLARDGGYVLHSDHSVPPEVGYAQFCWMQQRAQAIFANPAETGR